MATYSNLDQGNYYVIQELENSNLELVYVPLITDKCVLLEFQHDDQTLSWYRKSDEFFEVVDQLTEDQAVIYESLFAEDDEDDDDDFNWGDDEEEDDDYWETDSDGDGDDDDDSDEKIISLKN